MSCDCWYCQSLTCDYCCIYQDSFYEEDSGK